MNYSSMKRNFTQGEVNRNFYTCYSFKFTSFLSDSLLTIPLPRLFHLSLLIFSLEESMQCYLRDFKTCLFMLWSLLVCDLRFCHYHYLKMNCSNCSIMKLKRQTYAGRTRGRPPISNQPSSLPEKVIMANSIWPWFCCT